MKKNRVNTQIGLQIVGLHKPSPHIINIPKDLWNCKMLIDVSLILNISSNTSLNIIHLVSNSSLILHL